MNVSSYHVYYVLQSTWFVGPAQYSMPMVLSSSFDFINELLTIGSLCLKAIALFILIDLREIETRINFNNYKINY